MISEVLCRGMQAAAGGGSGLSPTSSGVSNAGASLGRLAATGSGISVGQDPFRALVEKLNELMGKLEAEMSAPAPVATVPAAQVPCKTAEKVELLMIADPSTNILRAAKENVKFTIIDVSGNKIVDIDSPLTFFEKYLDVSQLAKSNEEIIRGIISKAANKDVTIKPLIDAKSKLPSNRYTEFIKKALDLCVEFHEDILKASSPDNLIKAKKDAVSWYQHIPYIYGYGKDEVRKSLEILYNEAFVKAVKAHDMLVTAAEDYFNMYIVYYDRNISNALDDKSNKQDDAVKDICSNILGTIDTFTKIKERVKEIYTPSIKKFLDEKESEILETATTTGQTYEAVFASVKTDSIFSDLSNNKAIVSAFNSNPAPTSTDLATVNSIITDISDSYITKKEILDNYKNVLDNIIGELEQIRRENNTLNRSLTLFEQSANRSLITKIATEITIVKTDLSDASAEVTTHLQPYENALQTVTKALNDLEDLKTSVDIKNGVSAYTREQKAISDQKDIDLSNNPILEWKLIESKKIRVDASFNHFLREDTIPQYVDVCGAYTRVTKSYKNAEDALDIYNASETLVDLSKNLAAFGLKLPTIQADIRLFDTAYAAYYSTSATASFIQTGIIAKRLDYIREFIKAMFIDISATGVYPISEATLIFDLIKVGRVTGIDISTNKLDGIILTNIANFSIDRINRVRSISQLTRDILTAYRAVQAPATTSRFTDFINEYIRTHPVDILYGGRYRVTRRRLTGSKRRKTYVRRAKNGRHQ